MSSAACGAAPIHGNDGPDLISVTTAPVMTGWHSFLEVASLTSVSIAPSTPDRSRYDLWW